MQTGDIVGEAWDDEYDIQIDPSKLSTEEGKINLLDKLVKSCKNLKQAVALIKLLELWPPFEQSVGYICLFIFIYIYD